MSTYTQPVAETASATGSRKVVNFNPGPSILPLDVLKQAQAEFLDFKGTGMSVLEISHRSKEYEELNKGAMNLMRELLGLGDNYHVIFIGGGASTQFALVPMNFLRTGETAAYLDTGAWSAKAMKEAKLFGTVHTAASTKNESYVRIPKLSEIQFPQNAAYLHMTSNNTIFGTQWHWWPEVGNVPLVCDMSSDFCSRVLDYSKFAMIYAGAQKNIGPAGVTAVIIRDDFLARCKDGNPTMLDYRTHVKNESLYNTPPVFGVYMMKLVLEWIKSHGGLSAIEKINNEKQSKVYSVMDTHADFYRGTVQKDSRSWMNLTLRLPSEELETTFLAEAKKNGFVGLKGHRDVGGIRVSLYNAMEIGGVNRLVDFMESFRRSH